MNENTFPVPANMAATDLILAHMKRLDKAADAEGVTVNELVKIAGALAGLNFELYRTPPMNPAMMGSMLSGCFGGNPPANPAMFAADDKDDK